MFDIINKYSPHMKLNPWYDHQVHGPYGPEEALIDAIQTQSFRVTLASLHLFKHIKSWKKLYALAKKHDCWQQVGALLDISRKFMKTRALPKKYMKGHFSRWKMLTTIKHNPHFPEIEKKWKVHIPYGFIDIRENL